MVLAFVNQGIPWRGPSQKGETGFLWRGPKSQNELISPWISVLSPLRTTAVRVLFSEGSRRVQRSRYWSPGFVCSYSCCCCGCSCRCDCCGRSLVQGFATVPFLVQAALAALHHVNKVGQRLLLVHWNIPEVTAHRLQKGEKEGSG